MLLAILLAASVAVSPAMAVMQDYHYPIPTCEQAQLDMEIDGLLRPVLLALAEARRTGTTWDDKYEAEFFALLKSTDKHALEAQVALMAYYVGEHYGEELVCALQEHPIEALRLIKQYKACRPKTSFEEKLGGIIVLRTLYELAEEELKNPTPCTE